MIIGRKGVSRKQTYLAQENYNANYINTYKCTYVRENVHVIGYENVDKFAMHTRN